MIVDEIEKELFDFQDLKYRDFQAKLIPNVKIDNIIGVRLPIVRKIAKKYAVNQEVDKFLNNLPHKFYDEYNLQSYIISELKDYNKVITYINQFLPFVDNWATCDILGPKIFKKYKDELLKEIKMWINSKHTYTIRFGIEMLMSHYLDADFNPAYLNFVKNIKSEEYYVNMMIAWFFATALTKQWNDTIKVIETKTLPKWVQNKTIQKAVESYRITNEQKEYLKTFKI